jgi:phosphate transport system substrate-binding protein
MSKNRIVLLLALLLFVVVPFVGVAAQDQTAAEVIAGNADLSTLAAWIETAGLSEALAAEGPITVYAPSNEALAALPSVATNYLAAHPDVLTTVLTNHVVEGSVAAADGVAGANIVTGDLAASNGVVHVIDDLLVPDLNELLPEVIPAVLTGDIAIDGSSTVEPLTVAVQEAFQSEGFSGNISVGESGTGGGFAAFCEEAVTDISNASRAIRSGEGEEASKCEANGRPAVGFRVGTDGIAVVVSAANDFVEDVTYEELQAIFSTATNWSDVRAEWPAEPILRYTPGTDSGTWDFFNEEVFPDADPIPTLAASNLTQSENDNVLVQGVESSPYAVAYFGYAYYVANAEALKLVSIDGVAPTETSVEDGSYLLARPLFIYSSPVIVQEKPQVAGFINYYLQNVGDLIGDVGYFPASEASLNRAKLWFLAASTPSM